MKTPYSIVDLPTAVSQLDKDEPVFMDTETRGLYGEVRLLQLYQPHLSHVLMIENPDVFLLMGMFKTMHCVYHNAHYDITVYQQQSETRDVPDKLDCTFLLARLAYPEKEKFSLDAVMEYALGFDPYARQHLDKAKLQKTNWDVMQLTDEQLVYAATDVYYMPQVWECVKHKLDDIGYQLDISVLRKCLDFQWNGLPVDEQRLFDIYADNIKVIDGYDVPVNVNSWK
ncbi:MAG: hypothetical protein DRP93_07335, partial [Candidatus Neomarinimicrobiota bacterium]